MTDNPAAFSASYSDWRVVKGRKVIQIIFEIPIEAAGHAYNVLNGMPTFGAETWFAIARMQKPKE